MEKEFRRVKVDDLKIGDVYLFHHTDNCCQRATYIGCVLPPAQEPVYIFRLERLISSKDCNVLWQGCREFIEQKVTACD